MDGRIIIHRQMDIHGLEDTRKDTDTWTDTHRHNGERRRGRRETDVQRDQHTHADVIKTGRQVQTDTYRETDRHF